MRILTWDEFNSCVVSITHICRGKQFSGVYGLPRGGLCLAVALSHSLKIPFLNSPQSDCLVVDDVYETGESLRDIYKMRDITTFVWLSKVAPEWWNAVEIVDPNEWLVLPWESVEFAKDDQKRYQLSRGQIK